MRTLKVTLQGGVDYMYTLRKVKYACFNTFQTTCHITVMHLNAFWNCITRGGGGGGGGGGGYSSSSRAGRLGRTLWPQNSTSVAETENNDPPTLEKGGQYSTSVWKVCKKRGQKSTILKNIGVKILKVLKWGSKFYMLKNRGQNSTMLEKRGQYSTSDPKSRGQNST